MQRGFSLLELSIVLVIIGLLAGGIMVGQEMVRSAELRSVMTDIDKYKTAVNTFKLKYNSLPGDLKIAESYWGTASGGCPAGTGTGTQTCNGDGNGQVNDGTNEMYRFWQQLANAGLIEVQYTGVTDGAGSPYFCTAGVNCPATKINGGRMSMRYLGSYGGVEWFPGTYNHTFEIGNPAGWPTFPGSMFSASEAYGFDIKFDDGKPAYGNIVGLISSYWSTNCVTTAVAATAAWAVNVTTPACGLVVKSGF